MNDKDKIKLLEREVAWLKKLLETQKQLSQNWRNMYLLHAEGNKEPIKKSKIEA